MLRFVGLAYLFVVLVLIFLNSSDNDKASPLCTRTSMISTTGLYSVRLSCLPN